MSPDEPGSGETEKGEDRNETVAPDGSTVYEGQPQPEGGEQNVGYVQDDVTPADLDPEGAEG